MGNFFSVNANRYMDQYSISKDSRAVTGFYVVAAVVVLVVLFVVVNEDSDFNVIAPRRHSSTTTAPPVTTTVVTTVTPTQTTTTRKTVTPKYLTEQGHHDVHFQRAIDKELRLLAEQIISPDALAVPSRIAPRPATVAPHKAIAVPVKHKVVHKVMTHPHGCKCNLCAIRHVPTRGTRAPKRTPAPVCASMSLPLGRINYDNYDAWNPRPKMPWWAKPATRHPIDRPRYTVVPINWHMHPDHKRKHHHHAHEPCDSDRE